MRTRSCLVLLLLPLACSVAPRGEGPPRAGRRSLSAAFTPDAPGLLVLFRDGVSAAARWDAARRAGARVAYTYRAVPALYVTGDDPAALAASLRASPEVASVTPDRPLTAAPFQAGAAPRTPRASRPRVGLAVIDSGVDPDAGLLLADSCFSAFSDGCGDPSGRGTALARLAAHGDVAVYPVRILDATWAGTDATLLAGLDWVASSARLVSPPIRVALVATALDDSPALRAAERALADAGVVLTTSVQAARDQIVTRAVLPRVMASATARATTSDLSAAIDELAGFGEKRSGTLAGAAAAEWLSGRFAEAGLAGVRIDRFAFPFHTIDRSGFEVAGARSPAHRVLEASGAGRASGPLVSAGGGGGQPAGRGRRPARLCRLPARPHQRGAEHPHRPVRRRRRHLELLLLHARSQPGRSGRQRLPQRARPPRGGHLRRH